MTDGWRREVHEGEEKGLLLLGWRRRGKREFPNNLIGGGGKRKVCLAIDKGERRE